ncbi:hypothetical protein [Serratia sp. JSRIV006]|uniref:hypothetical protein n=1 Tax=Serratia sp. JSRIV006 TaxID=2831896 RepID=UPI001CBE646F|nr:hypothetical protein [Serratia sp. JSRIV006]UAN65892.1 hypothetical protein KGP16_27345 [Serratia sp. JSRIV006]
MNNKVITPEELEAAHTEALQINDRHDYFAAAQQAGFSATYAQAIYSICHGNCWSAISHLSAIRPLALAEDCYRAQSWA